MTTKKPHQTKKKNQKTQHQNKRKNKIASKPI